MIHNIMASFTSSKSCVTASRYKYDYGQRLVFNGIPLPSAYEVHFSNEESGQAKTVIGNEYGVLIPDEYFLTGETVYAWLFLHDEETDGRTMYKVKIPVINKAKPIETQPTPVEQDVITQTIAALNHAVELSETNVTHYPKIEDGTWHVWDAEANEWSDTGIEAHGDKGDTGNGIESAVLNSDYTLTLTFTDGTIYTTPSIRGERGEKGDTGNGITSVVLNADYTLTINFTDGTSVTTSSVRGAEGNGIRTISKTGTSGLVDTYTITFDDGETTTFTVTNGAKGDKGDTGATPNISIGTVETLEPNESATASMSGTAENPVLNLGIPQGRQGEVTLSQLEQILPTDTASGSIASFSDGCELFDAKSVVIGIEPIQDLHGQSAPYPSGGGKNKASVNELNGIGWAERNAELLASFNSLPAGTYTVSFDVKVTSATKTGAWQDGIVVLNPNGNVTKYNNFSADPTVGFTDTLTYTFTLDASQVGAFTSCYVYGCGSNGQGKMGEATFSSIQIEGGSSRTSFAPYSNECPISGWTGAEVNVSPTTSADDGTVYNISWQTEAGTVYGGRLDVTSGALTSNLLYTEFTGAEQWTLFSNSFFYTYKYDIIGKWNENVYVECTNGIEINASGVNGQVRVYLSQNPSLSADSDMNNIMSSGIGFLGTLATPQTYQLTPTEIALLQGQNNVWADCGDTEVTYNADIQRYISKVVNS